jgi:glycosyltransferase involved in cell wall biosynthesis
VYHLAYLHELNLLKKTYAKTMIQQAVTRSDHIITISDFSAQEIIKYTAVCPSKITTIHLSADPSHFSPQKDEGLLKKIREKYLLPEKFILFVSNLSPHKNLKWLLLAWKALCQEVEGWKLVIVGKKMKTHDWEEVLHQDPYLMRHVMFLGYVAYDDLPLIYQNAYASILPSFYEGFGLTPLESMSCGCPAIVSNVASLLEIFEKCALFVDPYDPLSMSRGIKTLLNDQILYEQLKAAGLKKARELTWDQVVEKHQEVIDRLLCST